MIEGFVLPEAVAFSEKNSVSLMRCCTFNSFSDTGDGNLGRDQQVNMIGHYDESVKSKIAQKRFATSNGFYNRAGYLGIVQPQRTATAFVED